MCVESWVLTVWLTCMHLLFYLFWYFHFDPLQKWFILKDWTIVCFGQMRWIDGLHSSITAVVIVIFPRPSSTNHVTWYNFIRGSQKKPRKEPASHMCRFCFQALRVELKEREHVVVSTLDQARMFLADQPIEGPEEPRKNMQPKTGEKLIYTMNINRLLMSE